MLEKAIGNMDIMKLRVILILEANFNALYKMVFNSRLIPKLEVREEIL